jgi:hypothetical protein
LGLLIGHGAPLTRRIAHAEITVKVTPRTAQAQVANSGKVTLRFLRAGQLRHENIWLTLFPASGKPSLHIHRHTPLAVQSLINNVSGRAGLARPHETFVC